MEAVAEELGQILQSRPEMMSLIGPEYFRHRDFPGAQDIADKLLKLRDRQYPGLEDDEESPEAAQAKVAALTQQLQAMQQQMQMLAKDAETDRAKQEATLLKTQMDNASKERIAAGENEVKVLIASMEARNEKILAALAEMGQDRRQKHDAAHDVAMGAAGGKADAAGVFPKTFGLRTWRRGPRCSLTAASGGACGGSWWAGDPAPVRPLQAARTGVRPPVPRWARRGEDLRGVLRRRREGPAPVRHGGAGGEHARSDPRW
jgi:hypothetical protein